MEAPSGPESTALESPSRGALLWQDLRQQAQRLASTLRTVAEEQEAPRVLATCLAYAQLLDEIVRWADAPEAAVRLSERLAPVASPQQFEAFGHLLRDKRAKAGFSRIQLARKAKLSDATIKFIETARHPPSRATLLRLADVPELGLSWLELPGALAEIVPAALEQGLSAAELHRLDSRLSLALVRELMLVLDELHTSQSLVEITPSGARRACCLCGMRSEAWTADATEAAKLPIRHGTPCAGRLVETLCQRHPVIAELATEERRARRSPAAAEIESSRQATQIEHFHGCRSAREVAALLAHTVALPSTPYRRGANEMLLWALKLGPCPVEPTTDAFSVRRAQQLAELATKGAARGTRDGARLQGISESAAWLLSSTAPLPRESLPDDPPQ